jgi:hypothetical protein
MTDNEIIKAFECCSNADRITECGRCPYYRKGCLDKVHADATDLINRQKAEIEKLTKLNDILLEAGQRWQKSYETLVKEFTEGEQE